MLRYLPAALAGALILAVGSVYGLWTNRWVDNPAMRQAAKLLPTLPDNIGNWHGEDSEPSEDQVQQFIRAELRSVVMRTYTYTAPGPLNGEQVDILATCGPPGPVSTHTPETCYGGVGHDWTWKGPVQFQFNDQTQAFLSGDFRRIAAIVPTGLKIYWSFRGGPNGPKWIAPEKPRLSLAKYPVAYKVYVIRQMSMAEPSPVLDNATPDFIEALLPALESTLFKPPVKPATSQSNPQSQSLKSNNS